MVRVDLFSGSLAVWNFQFGTAHIFCPPANGGTRQPLQTCIFLTGGVYWTKFDCISSWTLTKATNRARGARGGLNLNRTLQSARLVRSLRSREQRPKTFLIFLLFLGGGVGGADKKWKGNFWFCFAASDYEMNIFIISFVVYSRCSFLRPCGETRRFLSMFCGNLKLCGFDNGQW